MSTGEIRVRCATRTVEFLKVHAEIKDMLPQMVDMLVDNCRVMLSSSTNVNKQSELMEFLKGMKSGLNNELKTGMANMETKMNTSLVTLMTSVNTTITNSLSRLDVDKFSKSVSEKVQVWMKTSLATLDQSQTATTTSLAILTKEIRDKTTENNNTLRERHAALLMHFGKLPGEVSQLTALHPAETHRLLGELKTALITSLNGRVHEQARCDELVRRLSVDSVNMYTDAKNRNVTGAAAIEKQLALIPAMVKNTVSDTMTGLKRDMGSVRTYAETSKAATEEIVMMRKTTDDVMKKLDEMMKQTALRLTSNKVKGAEGEVTLYNKLCDHFSTQSDGYQVIETGKIAHSCDMNVKRLGYADVRIEVKAYVGTQQAAGTAVPGREVMKFQNDLAGLNTHGIMVSLHSGITGKGLVDFDQLPNGKMAVYLSKNEYDVVMVHHMIKLLYRMDEMCTAATGTDTSMIKISHETMKRVQQYMKDFGRKLENAKTHMKETLALLNDMTFDVVEKLLMGGGVDAKPAVVPVSVPPVKTNAVSTAAPSVPPKAASTAAPSVPHKVAVVEPQPYTRTDARMCTACDRVLKGTWNLTVHQRTCKQYLVEISE